MRNIIVLGIASISLLTACATPDVGMKIEKSRNDFEVLMGSMENASSPKTSSIRASNGDLTCEAMATTGKVTIELSRNGISATYAVKCSDGREGDLVFQGSDYGVYGFKGAGVGKLDDGSKIKIVVGDAAGAIGW